ncbi:hypothetical protein [Curtobacterium sp. KBS0715]|uniref:hypothetical protein n=1 Tax=Curtobacterium sp. KBS0715 TaxID=1179671 RepID=UPI00110D5147|nr:hypothetical protein [Curtobacterium sp. KBS0715]TSD12598.1 hypothetical protein FFG40_014375 [Curtobacterium sp. KBS0715]
MRKIDYLSEVDLNEWDLLVTDQQFAEWGQDRNGFRSTVLRRAIPASMYVFGVLTYDATLLQGQPLDFANTTGSNQPLKWVDGAPVSVLEPAANVAGHQVRRVDGLPEALQDLVQSDLLAVVEQRDYQHGFTEVVYDKRPSGLKRLRPFLIGPQDLILAGSYERIDGGSAWIIPGDVSQPEAWFSQALLEWHRREPGTFPAVAHWEDDELWMTGTERKLHAEVAQLRDAFERARVDYEANALRLTAELAGEREAARSGRRALLTAQDDAFQTAALEALTALGFDVEDMDEVWPDRERREDFRIRDADDPSWIVIGDATGVAKGAKASKLQTLGGYATKFVLLEHPPAAPGQWLIVNRLIDRDPDVRGDVFREDELKALAAVDGLAFDSAALFVLAEWADEHASDRAHLRSHLRGLKGQLTLQMARDWITAQNAA